MLQAVYEPFHEPKLARGSARCQPWLNKLKFRIKSGDHATCFCVTNFSIKPWLSAFWSDRTDVVHPCSRYILVALIAFLLHFPLHFPLHFILDPDTPVGTRSIPRSDRSNVSDFPRFVGRVRSQGFRGRSRFSSCLETELDIRFPIPTGFGLQVGRAGSQVKPGLDPTGPITEHDWWIKALLDHFHRHCKWTQ